MATMRIFVSHSHEDDAFCQAVVAALRTADTDVWYDEHNLGSGQLLDVIQRELASRPVFIVILSPAAMRSAWVKDETRWAYNLYKRDVTRTILPITAGAIQPNDFDNWLFLEDYKRIEAPGLQPYIADEAARRLLRALALTPRGETPAPTAPQPQENADDLIARGKALRDQKKDSDALPLFQRAIQLAPQSFEAWFNLGRVFHELLRWLDALSAYEQALVLAPSNIASLNNKGVVLHELKRFQEALAVYEQGVSLDSNNAVVWNGMGASLYGLGRYQESLDSYNQALTLNPDYADAWSNKGNTLTKMSRNEEALEAYDHALALDSNDSYFWNGKGRVLHSLQQYLNALGAFERAIQIDPRFHSAWHNKALTLRALGREAEAQQANARARELGWQG